jgi:two-component system response regulator HydG
VGETQVRRVDVRLIAATHRNLRHEVGQGTFRHDLYYRLNVIDLHVPPLRERPDDLQLLARELLERTVARLERPIQGYTPRALDRLLTYLWPGNIRELEHAIERACAVAMGPLIDIDDLPDAVRGDVREDRADPRLLATREIAFIRAVVARHHGHRRGAAEELGISISTLNRRLRVGHLRR